MVFALSALRGQFSQLPATLWVGVVLWAMFIDPR